jgi:peptide/nickel transport system substrate-binding protein
MEKLFDYKYGSITPEPSLAASDGEFTNAGTDYVVKLQEGLKFSNGHDLTSSDVKFSFDRIVKINDPNGPATMLDNLDSITTPDPLTVDFKLKNADDITFKSVLAANAGYIVDEETTPADKAMEDSAFVKANGFSGQYKITDYKKNESIQMTINPDYKGINGAANIKNVNMTYYTQASNLKMDIADGKIEFSYNGLDATSIEDLKNNPNVKVNFGDGGRFDFLVFDTHIQPFGSSQPDANLAKAKAVRVAVANLIDRDAIAKGPFKDTFRPVYSLVGNGIEGQKNTYKDQYGENGKPSLEKAKAAFAEAGITGKVDINLYYNSEHYEPVSTEEYNMLKSQLEESGLFNVTLATTEWVQYQKDRVNTGDHDGKYQANQMGWFNDYPDADNFIRPFFGVTNFLHEGYEPDAETAKLIASESGIVDKAERIASLEKIQDAVTADAPVIPIVQGEVKTFTSKSINGAEKITDALQSFRIGALSKVAS